MPALPSYLPFPKKTTTVTSPTGYPASAGGSGGNPLTPLVLDPNWGPAVYDTEKRGAELAVAGGYRGSPLAGYQTARMRAADIERRAALGDRLLSGEADRDLGYRRQGAQESQFGQTFDEGRRQFDERNRLDREKFDWEQQQRNLATQQAAGYRYQSGRGGYQPLPQYMNAGRQRNSYSLNRWTGGQPGQVWESIY